MKKLAIIAILAITFASCNNKKNADMEMTTTSDSTMEHHDGDMHHHDDAEEANAPAATGSEVPAASSDTKQSDPALSQVYNSYFSLKDALAKDDGKGAQSAAITLYDNIKKANTDGLTAEQATVWTKYKNKLIFDAEHIKGVDENDHQREHFTSLSKNMHEVIKVIKNNKTVYYQNCPMYNKGKGGNWLSLDSKIRNPYMGKDMTTCGSTTETIK